VRHLSRVSCGLAVAGLAVAGQAEAMPQLLWHGATHFGFECRLEGSSRREAAAFCARLAPATAEKLKLAYRAVPAPDGVVLRLDLRRVQDRLTGTMVAVRPALRGETDERSALILLDLDRSAPGEGFARAVTLLRTPSARPTPRRIRPIT